MLHFSKKDHLCTVALTETVKLAISLAKVTSCKETKAKAKDQTVTFTSKIRSNKKISTFSRRLKK